VLIFYEFCLYIFKYFVHKISTKHLECMKKNNAQNVLFIKYINNKMHNVKCFAYLYFFLIIMIYIFYLMHFVKHPEHWGSTLYKVSLFLLVVVETRLVM